MIAGSFALAAAFLLVASPRALGAQDVRRPELPHDADPNDWEAYYDFGIDRLTRPGGIAQDAFVWASRLDPSRAEPLYARWIAFWELNVGRFERSLNGDERVLQARDVIAADSLRIRAFQRNPFVHQGLVVHLYDQLPGRWRDDALTRGWINYGQGHLERALDYFGMVIHRDPEKHGHLRFERASAFVNLARNDSAATELDSLLAQLRTRDDRALVTEYESKELLEYARGLLHLNGGRVVAAREAFARALSENPGFAPAHARMGDIAIANNDTTTAMQEYALAVDVAPDDPMMHVGYGRALGFARRDAEAAGEYRRATLLAPWYAEPYGLLAAKLEKTGDRAGARAAYVQFLAHARRNDPRRADVEHIISMIPESGN